MKLKSTLSFCLLITLALTARAELKLFNRYTYFYTDAVFSSNSVSSWNNSVTMKNGATYRGSVSVGAWCQYKASIDSLVGMVDIQFFRAIPQIALIDSNIKVEILHNGIKDYTYVDFSTKKESWFSVGKYYFSGQGTEYVRLIRETTNSLLITPTLPVRFDCYADTHTRALTSEENSLNVSIGFSSSGLWQPANKTGYRAVAPPKYSKTAGSSAIWHPGTVDSGQVIIYIYKPKVNTKDKFTIVHNGKVDSVNLRDLKWANYNVISPSQEKINTNPMPSLGWYKVGEFDFSGDGKEFVKLHKTSTDSTFADCMMFETVKYDGTILYRTVVTTNTYSDGLFAGTYPLSFDEKEKITNVLVGFSPQTNSKKVQFSSYNGSTPYSRAYYLPGGTDTYYWNPLVVEPGNYDFYYYNFYNMATNPNFTINSNGGNKTVSKAASEFPGGTFTLIGNYTFACGSTDEYIKCTGINRASDILLEKKVSNSAILRQVVATCYPYFKEYVYADTKGTSTEQAVSFMVKKGFVFPRTETNFGTNMGITRAEFVQSVVLMLGLTPNITLPNFSDVLISDWYSGYFAIAKKKGLLYAVADTGSIYPNFTIRRDEAAQIMLNAMEYSGNYINVKNFFKAKADSVLKAYGDEGSIRPQYREAFGRMVETGVLKAVSAGKLLGVQELKRGNAVVILKEFLESLLRTGPIKAKTDFQLTFNDEFNGPTLDYSKWSCDNYVRFAGISGKWKENCVVEDGVFKGYNFMDNHLVPYSSGNISSKFKQSYGFFESRYKYPEHAFGSHTSFWSSGGTAGDNNYNEGSYPNGIGTNNYFMAEPNRSFGFLAPDNLSKDFHTNGGYTGEKDIFYTWDGKIYGAYSDVTPFLVPSTGSTNGNYPALASTIVTYFDGPLDRDRLDGTFATFDWVRVYKVITWQPEVEVNNCIPVHNAVNQPINVCPVLKFNKSMDSTSVKIDKILISEASGSIVPSYIIEQMTPLRFRIKFSQVLEKGKTYNITVKSIVKDIVGNSMINDTLISFSTESTISLTVNAIVNSPVVVGGIIQLNSTVSGGSGNYTSYNWTGPNSFSSNQPNPVINGADVANSGNYYLKVTDDVGNTGDVTVFLAVDALNSVSSTLFKNTKFFPNPSNGNIWIIDSAFVENPTIMISVSDFAGKIVFADNQGLMPGIDRFDLNLAKLESGLYFLNLKTKEMQKSFKLSIRK
jgi:hypothetical protein